jgi:Dual specificity phosphatase, catalytic domain
MVDTNEDDSADESCDTKLGVKRLLRRSSDIADNSDACARTIYPRDNLDSAVSGMRNTSTDVQHHYRESSLGVVGLRSNTDFNFRLTEGQSRRGLMADCESECSPIFDFLFVGGAHIARSWKTLEERKITRIVNCSAAVVDNHFLNDPKMKYLSLNMVDGRQDDISWFLGDVLQFIMSGRKNGENVLIHCERGVSRSCSFAIAYHIWTTGEEMC